MENNEAMVNDEELNDVEVIDTDEVCEQDDSEVTEGGLDGLSFAAGAIVTLLIAKGVKKVVNSAPVQNEVNKVKTKWKEHKEARAAAKEAKKLKIVDTTVVKEAEVEPETEEKVVGK